MADTQVKGVKTIEDKIPKIYDIWLKIKSSAEKKVSNFS